MPSELIQEKMIDRVRQLCHQDERISVALMYGSFSRGEGDEYSDIEFYLFIRDSNYDAFDAGDWIQRISPVGIHFVNQMATAVVIFENLIRGEFSFHKLSQLPMIRAFKQVASFKDIDSLVVLDRDGHLREHLDFLASPDPVRSSRENVIWMYNNFLNSMLLGVNVLARGERARALDTLEFVQKFLLWLVRIHEDKLLSAETRAYKNLEKDMPGPIYAHYIKCTGSLHGNSLERAYRESWLWGKELISVLAGRFEIDIPYSLIESMDLYITSILNPKILAHRQHKRVVK